MPTTSVNIGFRPPRIATLVREDSLSDIAEAAAANTHVWGGRYNPIVAVGNDVDAAIAELRSFRPDLVTVIGEPTPEQSAVIGSMKHLRAPALAREPFEQQDNGGMPYADIRLICRHYYETTFRFGVTESRARMVDWPKGDDVDAYMRVVFGRYRTGQRGDSFRRAFIEGLSATTVGLDELATVVGVVTPIGLTATSLTALPGSREAGVVVGRSTSPTTLLTYWNLRSVGCDVVLWPTDRTGPLADHARAELVNAQPHWSRPGRRASVSLWMDQHDGGRQTTPPKPPEDLVRMLAETGIRWAHGLRYSALWNSPLTSPCVWAARARAVLASVETRSNGVTELVAALPPHPFSPADDDRFPRPRWLVTITTHRHHDLGRHTFNIPPIPTLTPWASGALQIIGDVRLEAKGVAVFADIDATSVTLRLVEQRAVVERMFTEAGLTATVSPAGEAADRIIRQMGGLWRCRELRLHGLRAILRSGTRAWTWQEAMRRLHDGGAYRATTTSRRRQTFSAPSSSGACCKPCLASSARHAPFAATTGWTTSATT